MNPSTQFQAYQRRGGVSSSTSLTMDVGNKPDDEKAKTIATTATVIATSSMRAVSSAVPQGLIAIDTVLDLVPLGSTASNVIDLGLKHLVIKDMDPESSVFKDYIAHIQKKKTSECLVYTVPILGNIVKLGSLIYGWATAQKDEAPKSSSQVDSGPFCPLPPYLEALEAMDGACTSKHVAGLD
jgi:hypothetical protein